ncbi:MAG: YceI family protein [Gammaproteobacteria bacterium]|jgi:polyisoprenoid-binding protein YceI|nr:YceI family protein [Gammaproteobacteria bacterium]
MIKTLLCWWGLLACIPAAAADWEEGPGSTLRFAAVQQGARFEGRFSRFAAHIDFDAAQPGTGSITADIDLGSVDTQYEERDDYLRDPEWFHIARWPQARFRATAIEPADNGFVAHGELTLRGVTQPVDLAFTFTTTATGARLAGTASLQRLDFGVGTGDWADTRWVGNDVQVMVDLQLLPAATP